MCCWGGSCGREGPWGNSGACEKWGWRGARFIPSFPKGPENQVLLEVVFGCAARPRRTIEYKTPKNGIRKDSGFTPGGPVLRVCGPPNLACAEWAWIMCKLDRAREKHLDLEETLVGLVRWPLPLRISPNFSIVPCHTLAVPGHPFGRSPSVVGETGPRRKTESTNVPSTEAPHLWTLWGSL
jgi:hypothetical protein